MKLGILKKFTGKSSNRSAPAAAIIDHSDQAQMDEDLLSAQPMEIIFHILSFLDNPNDILACSLVNRRIGVAADEFKFKRAIHQLRAIIGLQTDDLHLQDYCPAGFVKELRATMIRLSQEVDYLRGVLPSILQGMPNDNIKTALEELHQRLITQKNGQFKNISEMEKLSILINDINTHIANRQIAAHMTVYINLRHLTRITPEFIDTHFEQLCRFNKLYLQNNFLITVPNKLLANSQANVVKLHNNQLRQIPKYLFLMPKLAELHLQNNQILEVPAMIIRSQTLRHLFLQHNHLIGLPERMEEMKQLVQVGLTHNHITEDQWEHIKENTWSRSRNDTQHIADKPAWQTDIDVSQLVTMFESFSLAERKDSKRLKGSCEKAASILEPKAKAKRTLN